MDTQRISFTKEELRMLILAISEFNNGMAGQPDEMGLSEEESDAIDSAEMKIRRARRKQRFAQGVTSATS